MFCEIETWEKSGQTKQSFCSGKKYSKTSFYYWLKKYQNTKDIVELETGNPVQSFLPVNIGNQSAADTAIQAHLEICYPNGVRIICPSQTRTADLQTLINL